MLTRDDYKVRLDWALLRFYRDLAKRVEKSDMPNTVPAGTTPALDHIFELMAHKWNHFLKYGEGYWSVDLPVLMEAITFATAAMELIDDHHVVIDKYHWYKEEGTSFSLSANELRFFNASKPVFVVLEDMVKVLQSDKVPNGEKIGPEYLIEIHRARLGFAQHLCDLAIGIAGTNPHGDEKEFLRKWRGRRQAVRTAMSKADAKAARYDHDGASN